jgi:hypothetical protein
VKVLSNVLLVSLWCAAATRGDEGMWMPSQIPSLAKQLRAAGLELDPAKLADLTGDPMGAVVSLGGCTASFVSPLGLIVTNHHCVYGSIQFNSTPERDLIDDGFLAKSPAEELPAAPGSYVYVTTAIRDVTTDVLGGIDAGTADADRARLVERRQREMVDACEQPGGLRCRVADFYEGTSFQLVVQMEIRDVRLVYAPSEGIGDFGGEIDNWMWPRHVGDFGFLRAYVAPDGQAADPSPGNVPYHPAHWLRASSRGIQPGELVWIPGYPGRTNRYWTLDEAERAQTFAMPEFVGMAKALIAILEQENRSGREAELANYGRIRGFANTMKKYEGELVGMRDGKIQAQRSWRERQIGRLLALDPRLAAELGDPLAELRTLDGAKWKTGHRDFALDLLTRYSSVMLSQAVTLWRSAEERPKPDFDREDGYRDRDRSRFLQGIARAQRSIEPRSDRAGLHYALARALELPADQRIGPLDAWLTAAGKATDGERIEALLDTLYGGTRTTDLAVRKAMADESTAALAARGDSMIDFVRALAPLMAERRERDRAFDGAMLRVRPRYMHALEHLAGGRLYPDANSTLRFTFGKVSGYEPRDAVAYAPRTSLAGVVAKATGEAPFRAPAALLAAARHIPGPYADRVLDSVPVDFLSTCDITGGNSGSPTLNGRGELVGLAFDGNWEGVDSDFLFDPEIVRTIHVDVVYMRWVMDEVDKAHDLLREMGLPVVTAE